jgi:peptidoglycan hydrolase CwlO-like protein
LTGLILRNTKRVHEQVANNHIDDQGRPINMRDDLDEKFEGLADLVKEVSRDVGGLKEDVRIIRRDQTADRAAATRAATAAAEAAATAREALERTQPKPYTRRKPE